MLNPAYTSDFVASISQPLLRGARRRRQRAARSALAFYDLPGDAGAHEAGGHPRARRGRPRLLAAVRGAAGADRPQAGVRPGRRAARARPADRAARACRRRSRSSAPSRAWPTRSSRSSSPRTPSATASASSSASSTSRAWAWRPTRSSSPRPSPTRCTSASTPTGWPAAALDGRMEMLELELRIAARRGQRRRRPQRDAAAGLARLHVQHQRPGRRARRLVRARRATATSRTTASACASRCRSATRPPAARLRRAILNRLQRLATREQRALQIRQEVYNAVDQLEANWQRIVAARQRTVLRRPRAGRRDAPVRAGPADQHRRARRPDAPGRRAARRRSPRSPSTRSPRSTSTFATGTLLGAANVVWTPAAQPK